MKRLFWDVETSPNVIYSWRVGRKIHVDYDNIVSERAIICIAWKWQDQKAVRFSTWDKGNDRRCLEAFAKEALTADELVAHNGDSFDRKWLNTRTLYHKLPPLPKFKTVDTLKISRSQFYFNSNRLDYLGGFLGEGRKLKTTFGLWKAIIESGCPKALARIVRYCQRDVRQLQRIYERMAPYTTPKSHAGVLVGLDKWSCPHCGGKRVHRNQTRTTAKGTLQTQMHCAECGHYYAVCNRALADYILSLEKH